MWLVVLLGVYRPAARSHHRERPGRELDGPRVPIGDPVSDFDARIGRRKRDAHFLFDPGRLLGIAQRQTRAVPNMLDRHVVRRVRAREDFGRVPEPVSAVVVPFSVADPAQCRRVVVEQVLPADETQTDDPRADYCRRDELDLPVGQANAAGPAAVLDYFHGRRRVTHRRRSRPCRSSPRPSSCRPRWPSRGGSGGCTSRPDACSSGASARPDLRRCPGS